MKTGDKGIILIKRFESCRLQAYKCPAGVWTIGYGHTGNVIPGDKITMAVADSLLRNDLRQYEGYVNQHQLSLNQNQFDAMVSLCYNIGPGNLKKSPVLQLVKKDPFNPAIRDAFLRHVYANGSHDGKDNDGDGLIDEPGEVQKLPGLVKRRTDEANLYFS
jgi:lysozyme